MSAMRMRDPILGAVLALSAILGPPAAMPAVAADSAVIFMYHRFGEDRYPSTNIRLEQFEAHIAELLRGGYAVLPVPKIVEALAAGAELPDRTVGLTVDDAFQSVLTEAWPRLKAAGLPFTLFISTDPIDRGGASYMSWDDIRRLAADELVTIGHHTATHLHMPDASRDRLVEELQQASGRFQAELGFVPKVFAYPYGEYGQAIGQLVRENGLIAAFGQHSGVAHTTSNMFYLPRFALNEAYGDLGRFKLAANALPIPVTDVTPVDPLLTPETNPPPFGFTVMGDVGRSLGGLRCYSTQEVTLEHLGERRIEVRVPDKFGAGRSRINCTMQSPQGRWRWFGMQFYVPSE